MEKELNQHEIDAMVQAARGGGPKQRQVADWDYRKAGRLARDQIEERGRTGDVNFDNVRFPDEVTRITSSYAVKLNAMELRLAACGDYVWVRILTRNESTNLLFRRSIKETFALDRKLQVGQCCGRE